MSSHSDDDYASAEEIDELELEGFSDSNISLLLSCDSKSKRKNYISYYFENGRNFIESIQPWTFNHPLKMDHVTKIKLQLLDDPTLTGVFTIIQLATGQLVLIDGHHRHCALLSMFQDGFRKNIEVEVHCYLSDTIHGPKTTRLFQKLNNTKPFQSNQHIILDVITIMKAIETKYPNVLRGGKKRANFPNLHREQLNDRLQEKLGELDDYNVDEIILQIKQKNRYYRKNAERIIQENKKRKWVDVESRLSKVGCYLGIVDMEEWISQLN